jgi:hypothetical protein
LAIESKPSVAEELRPIADHGLPLGGKNVYKSTLIFGECDAVAVLVDAMVRWLRPRLPQIELRCTS